MSDLVSQRWRVVLIYSAFGLLFCTGILLMCVPDKQRPSSDFRQRFLNSVRVVASLDGWNSILHSGRYIIFVDCDWNGDIVAFRAPFSEFADWCWDETDYQPISSR